MPEAFGRYLLLDKFAVGTVAELWRAQRVGDARIIAVKRLFRHVTEDEAFVRMFFDEVQVARLLSHPNIAAVHDIGKEGDNYYEAGEYVSGLALSMVSRATRKNPPSPFHAWLGLAAFIAQQAAEALAYTHALTDREGTPLCMLHRDVSPDNVLLSWSGDVKVTDFSVAKAFSTGNVMMKARFRYMSPEQIMGLPLDGRSDQFALGTVLYELCTGTPAFEGANDFKVLEKVRDADVAPCADVNPAIPPRLARVITRTLAREPKDRFSSAAELSKALADVLATDFGRTGQNQLAAWLRATFPDQHAGERALLASYAPPPPAPPEPTHDPLLEQMIAAFAKHKPSD